MAYKGARQEDRVARECSANSLGCWCNVFCQNSHPYIQAVNILLVSRR